MKTPGLSDRSVRMLICLCLPAASLFAQAGSLAGSVTDDANRPIVGALITANIDDTLPAPSVKNFLPTNPSISPVNSGRATSGPQGMFQIGGLSAGSYSVCVQVWGGGFVNDCEWATASFTIDLKTGQAVTGLQFKLKRAAILRVRLDDPGKFLEKVALPSGSPSSLATASSHVFMAVQTTRGLWHPLSQVSKDATGTIHAVTVPFDTAVSFTIASSHVSLADEKGTPLAPAGSNVPVTLPSGLTLQPLDPLKPVQQAQPRQDLTFKVTGTK